MLLLQFLQVLASGYVVTDIHQGNRVIKMLFRRFELADRRALQMLVADIEMNRGAVVQFLDGGADHLLKMWLRLLVPMLLHSAPTGLVALQRLRVAGLFGHGFLRRRALGHVQTSS